LHQTVLQSPDPSRVSPHLLQAFIGKVDAQLFKGIHLFQRKTQRGKRAEVHFVCLTDPIQKKITKVWLEDEFPFGDLAHFS